MALNVEALVAVMLLSASPVGEILVAIPAGVALGVEPFTAFVVAFSANLVPIIILLLLMNRFERRFPRLFNYFAGEGGRFRKRLEGRYGSAIMLLITPLIGVYATSVASKLLRFGKLRSFLLQITSLVVYGLIETVGLYFGIQLLPTI